MGARREVWVNIRASEAERAEWHGKARSVGLSLSDLVRRSACGSQQPRRGYVNNPNPWPGIEKSRCRFQNFIN